VVQALVAHPQPQPLGFDLNEPVQPPDDDLGIIENVFPGLRNVPQQPFFGLEKRCDCCKQ
jgi:hypothetical protein